VKNERKYHCVNFGFEDEREGGMIVTFLKLFIFVIIV
jgi:hypothetical protein